MLWNATHRDAVHAPPGLDDLWANTLAYASAIKAFDPAIKIHGPVTWGWCDVLGSAKDECARFPGDAGPDRLAHGNKTLIQWYLEQVVAHKAQTGVQLIDALDVHWYPQGGEFSNDESPAMAALRMRSVRNLYNFSYVDESWMGQFNTSTALIPRLRDFITAAGADKLDLDVGISEYNWGGDSTVSGALAQVDVMGVFVREGLDFATRWVRPEAGTPVEAAMMMFLSFDSAGTGVAPGFILANTTNSDVDRALAHAFVNSTTPSPSRRLRLIVVNKEMTYAQLTNVNVTVLWPAPTGPGPKSVSADVYQFSRTAPALTYYGGFEIPCPWFDAAAAARLGATVPNTFTFPTPGWAATLLDIPIDGCSGA